MPFQTCQVEDSKRDEIETQEREDADFAHSLLMENNVFGMLSNQLGIIVSDFFAESVTMTIYMMGPTATNIITAVETIDPVTGAPITRSVVTRTVEYRGISHREVYSREGSDFLFLV